MKLALVQYSPIWENKNENMNELNSILNSVDSGTDAIIFPEMTLTGFTMKAKQNAEELDGESFKFFINQSRRLKKNIFAGIIEKTNEGIYNSLFHFDELGLIKAVYKKIHPFSLADEDKFYSSGTEEVITKIGETKIGLSICYDLRFPELYRKYAKSKTEIMINIANWPVKRIQHWKHLLRARAIENQCVMIGVNRIGNDPYQTYNGSSAVFDHMGDELFQADNKKGIFYVDIDTSKIREIREKLNFLDDIRLI